MARQIQDRLDYYNDSKGQRKTIKFFTPKFNEKVKGIQFELGDAIESVNGNNVNIHCIFKAN